MLNWLLPFTLAHSSTVNGGPSYAESPGASAVTPPDAAALNARPKRPSVLASAHACGTTELLATRKRSAAVIMRVPLSVLTDLVHSIKVLEQRQRLCPNMRV